MTNDEWIKEAKADSLWVVENVKWPWTDRQKRIWFIGVLAGWVPREQLEKASLEQLQKLHDEVTHS